MTWKFYDVKIILWVLIGNPLIASTNIDCGGRSFHCLNSTHFRICVDLGGGVSTTVDDFVIPCPSPTVCSHSNRFECEFPESASIPLEMLNALTTATNELESATTLAWEEIAVPTTLSFNTSVGHLELQNYTTVSTESLLVEVTSPVGVINISENETVTEIIPIPNTTFKPQITTDDILATDTLQNVTGTVVDVNINQGTLISEVTSNITQANTITPDVIETKINETVISKIEHFTNNATEASISASNTTENKINETMDIPKMEVITSNATEANVSSSNMIDNNVEKTIETPQIEVITSTELIGNTITFNVSENSMNEGKAITTTEVNTNTVTPNATENNFVTNTHETSTDINAGISDISKANLNSSSILSSVTKNITVDTTVTLRTPIVTVEGGKSNPRVDDMVTKVSTAPNSTKTAETMNTISVTTIHPSIIVPNITSVTKRDSVNQSVIPVEVDRKKATEVIDSVTIAVPAMVNTDVNASLNSDTLVEGVIPMTTAINIDITSTLPTVPQNQASITESMSYVTNIQETTTVTPSSQTVSATISKASSLVEHVVTQKPIFNENMESNAQNTALTTTQATDIVSNIDDNLILDLKTSTEESTLTTVNTENVPNKVQEDINTDNATTSTLVPITIQKVNVVPSNSQNLDWETLITTTISNVNTESNVKENTEASNTIVTVITDTLSNTDINPTANIISPVGDSITSSAIPTLKTFSNITENTDVFNVTKMHNIDTGATIDSNILIEELTAPNIINTSASVSTYNNNHVSISSTTSPNLLTTVNSDLIRLTENTTPSSVSETDQITTEHKLKENTDNFETIIKTTINNLSPLFHNNTGGINTVAVETKKPSFLSVSTATTTTDNIIKIETSSPELDIIKFTTESDRDFTTEYPSVFAELTDNPTTPNTKLNNVIRTGSTNMGFAANDNKTITVNASTNETFQENANVAINNIKSGTLTGNHSISDTDIVQLKVTDATINETSAADKGGALSSSGKSSDVMNLIEDYRIPDIQLNTTDATIIETAATEKNVLRSSGQFSDDMSTTENYQEYITTTNDHQLNFETATSYILPTQLIPDMSENILNISEVISLNETNVLPTDDRTNSAIDLHLESNITNNQITIDNVTPTMEVVHFASTVFVTEYLTTEALSNEAQQERSSGIIVDENDESTTPISNTVYTDTTNKNELLKTAANSDFENATNQADITLSPNGFPMESSLTDDATTYIIATLQSASEVQTPNTSSYVPTAKEPFGTTSQTILLKTASILESNNINATGDDIAKKTTNAKNTLYNNTNSIERTSAMSITLTPKVTSVAPDAMMSTETVESTTQDKKTLNDTAIAEEQTISIIKDFDDFTINAQLLNVPTTTRSVEILVNTESALQNRDLTNTDIIFHSVAPSTEENIISSVVLSGNELPINNKSPINDNVIPTGKVDKSTLLASFQTNKLTHETKQQNDLLNTTVTKRSSSAKFNTETGNTASPSIARPPTDRLITERSTTTEYERISSLQPLDSRSNVQLENGVANKLETGTTTQTMTRYVDNKYVNPSTDSFTEQGKLKSDKIPTRITKIVAKKTNLRDQDFITNVLLTDVSDKPTTDTAIGGMLASTALSPAMNAFSNQDSTISVTFTSPVISGGSNTNSLSTNTAPWVTTIVQEHFNSDKLRSVNKMTHETIAVAGNENKNSILSTMNSTSSPHSGTDVTNFTTPLENVHLNTDETSANHNLITSVLAATTDRPAGVEESSSFVIPSIESQSANEGLYTSKTDRNVPQATFFMKLPSAYKPDAIKSIGSSTNTDQIALPPKTVNWQRTKVQERVSSGVQRSSNIEPLEIIPLTRNETQANFSTNVASKSTTSPNNGDMSNITNPLENVVFNKEDESVNDNLTISAPNMVTFPPAGIPTSTENSSFMVQSDGSLSVSSSNADDDVTPLDVMNSNVSVLPDRAQTIPQLSNINSVAINLDGKKPTINNIGVNTQTETNAENLANTVIRKVPVSISENTQNTDNVVNEDKNAVKDSKWHLPSESVKNNNISLSMQSTSILSITTTNGKLNVTETIFANSTVEFHTANVQPSIDDNSKSLTNSEVAKPLPLNDNSNLSNNGTTNIPVVIVDKGKVNIELSFVQNFSHPLTETSASSTQNITKPPNTATVTEAAVSQTQTTRSTTGQLNILNTVKVDVESTDIDKKLNFDCQNRRRGRYSDNIDCRKFYVCIGLRQPIEGLCPVNTVFSEIKKQCTKNLSYCIRQNQFKCVANGRFSAFLEQNVYFICVKNNRGEFVRFKFQCQNGYKLNKITVRCVEDEIEPLNKSISNDSEATVEKSSSSNNRDDSKMYDNSHSTNKKAKNNVLRTVKDKSSSEKRKGKENFECKKEGKFPDPKSCRKYYVCSKSNRSEQYRQRRKNCDSDEVFHKDKKKCVDADSFECS